MHRLNQQMCKHFKAREKGLTLVELLIAMALGLMISGAIIQIMVSNQVTDQLNKAVASAQENGRFIISRMRQELLMTGLYDPLNPNLNRNVDIVEEGAFVRNNSVVLANTFAAFPNVGAAQGVDGDNDELAVAMQADRDCRGYKLGYLANEDFFVVNQYFVENGTLKCRGYDGRVLRGQKVAVGHNNHAAISLMDDVLSFQVLYGVAKPLTNAGQTRPTQFVTADALPALINNDAHVVSIRIALVVRGEGDGVVNAPATFKLLNEATIAAPDNGLYKAFEATITLRNAQNFARGRA